MSPVRFSHRLLLISALVLALAACGGRSNSNNTGQNDVQVGDTTVTTPDQSNGQDQSKPDVSGVEDTQQPNDGTTTQDTTAVADTALPPYTKPTLFVGPHDFQSSVVAQIDSAEKSIYLTIYQFTQNVFANALIAAKERGVVVKVIFDRQQTEINGYIFDKLKDAGIDVKLSTTYFVYTHSKTLVIDEKKMVTMSMNLIGYSINSERNYGVVDHRPDHVKDALEVFNADWDYRAPQITGTDLVVAPQNARERLLAMIASAKSTLEIQHMQLSDYEVQQAIVKRAKAGVAVRILLANPGWIKTNIKVACNLGAEGLTTHYFPDTSKYPDWPTNHAKLVIVDDKKVFIGSVNFSTNSLNNNRELGVILDETDVVSLALSTFNKDWNTRKEIWWDESKTCSEL